jgi:hypothetical protein
VRQEGRLEEEGRPTDTCFKGSQSASRLPQFIETTGKLHRQEEFAMRNAAKELAVYNATSGATSASSCVLAVISVCVCG